MTKSQAYTWAAKRVRAQVLRNVDKILVLKEGYIVEEGTHEELIRLGGLYSRLCKMQTALAVVVNE